jgi:antitoxin (DNA-binding transcriptional repressor) of toxin-antitoxin stability system
METRLTATQLTKRLSEILSRVRYRGEHCVIERNGVPVATLGPAVPSVPAVTLRDVAARVGELALPGDDFADDLAAVQADTPGPTR